MSRWNIRLVALVVSWIVAVCQPAAAQEPSASDLAAKAQNPIANLISLPLQNNTQFGVGPGDDTANVLNIQPVIPINVGDWNVITRTIAPLIWIPTPVAGLALLPEQQAAPTETTFGLGDINFTAFLSPAKSDGLVWGVGPSVTLPTATDDATGSGSWSIGPSVVALTVAKPWVVGALARQLWSFAGSTNVSQFLLQPFVNYNFEGGWYLSSAPIITANWERDNDDRWVVPIGGGGGRVFNIGGQPINAQVQGFYNPVRPDLGAEWTLRIQLQFLFPK